jgi:hypothetical protein
MYDNNIDIHQCKRLHYRIAYFFAKKEQRIKK